MGSLELEVTLDEEQKAMVATAARFAREVLRPAGEILSALSIGLAQAAFDETRQYAKTRIQGGKPIIEHQSIALKLFRKAKGGCSSLLTGRSTENCRAPKRDLLKFNPSRIIAPQ